MVLIPGDLDQQLVISGPDASTVGREQPFFRKPKKKAQNPRKQEVDQPSSKKENESDTYDDCEDRLTSLAMAMQSKGSADRHSVQWKRIISTMQSKF